jgi:DNA-directed RNA polymerase specialized sigma24 family protein
MKITLTDKQAVALTLKGRTQAFEVIYTNYFVHVKRKYETHLNFDSNTAKDLAQDFFIQLMSKLDKYNPEFEFNAWVTGCSDNFFADYIRDVKAKKNVSTISLDNKVSDDENASFSDIITEDFYRRNKKP